jgi:hypothetical protein
MKEQTKKRMVTRWVRVGAKALVGLSVIAGVLLWARSNSGATGTPSSVTTTSQSAAMMQTNEGGQITVKVTWQGRNAGPVFSVEMDTHVVNLDGYDLRQLASLRTDQGQEIQPASWNGPWGGHHRSGTLTFPATLGNGTPLIGPNTRSITLVIRNVGDVPERTFTWTL